MYFLFAFLLLSLVFYNKLSKGRCRSHTCLLGKTALVTGGNSGIGYQIVLALAGRGCRVILADKDNSEASRNRIIAQTNNPHVINKHLDLANFQSIRTFAEDITKTEAKLDILINNAGIIFPLSLQTIDGLDRLMQVNHLGPFLLTHLLIDLLKVSLPSRIIFSSSASAFTHTLSTENFLALTKESIRSQFATYVNSKLCNLITVKVLAEKMKNTGITVNSAHPGVVLTNIYDTAYKSIAYCWPNKITKHIFPLILPIFKFFGKTVEEGAQSVIHLALSKKLENTTGMYFCDCLPARQPSILKNEEFCGEIWKLSEDCVKLKPNEKLPDLNMNINITVLPNNKMKKT